MGIIKIGGKKMDEFNNNLENKPLNEYEIRRENKRRNRKKSGKSVVFLAICFSLIGSILGSAITYNFLIRSNMNSSVTETEGGSTTPVKINASDSENVGSAVFKKVVPSVVGITTKGYQRTIFGTQAITGTGSGVIISKDGYILTNSHVIRIGENIAKDVEVFLNDGQKVKGKVVWSDKAVDIAIVKIEGANNLVPAELGDSDALEVGQTAIAIGNPIDLAFQRSLSKGVISGLNRFIGQVDGGGYMVGLIQTDASINGGNSGGPLVDQNGKIIGINTVKLQSAEGMGFAIPINSIKPIIESVLKTGEYQPVALGATIMPVQSVQRMVNKSLGTNYGQFIAKVESGSPAEKAGIKKGDILMEIDGTKVVTNEVLRALLYKYNPGDVAKATILRNGKEVKIEITFTDYKVPKQKIEEGLPGQNGVDPGQGDGNQNDQGQDGGFNGGQGNSGQGDQGGYGYGDMDDFLDFFNGLFNN
ncbi:trypsin [Peptoniphilus duerdenii ATCC BAA-1640]|uniref:Trypsin n=2 Tax=Peptoniphilus TaxID=162289 RepID=E0NIN4_9FIRM|nr:trypsin [Peptoniphilus duerdenii ATCC BAA-1640]